MGTTRYSDTNHVWDYEKSMMRHEIEGLKDTVDKLTTELKEIKELLKARPSFTDFKVFKFNEEEEIRTQQEIVRREMQERLQRLSLIKYVR